MPLDKLLEGLRSKKSETAEINEEEYIELDASSEKTDDKVKIRTETISEFDDVEKVQDMLRNKEIVWIKIKPLKDKDVTELKRAIDRLKKTVNAINGDIAGVDEEWLVACPEYAKIHR